MIMFACAILALLLWFLVVLLLGSGWADVLCHFGTAMITQKFAHTHKHTHTQ